jgi:hypothetical protein
LASGLPGLDRHRFRQRIEIVGSLIRTISNAINPKKYSILGVLLSGFEWEGPALTGLSCL